MVDRVFFLFLPLVGGGGGGGGHTVNSLRDRYVFGRQLEPARV